MNSNPPCQFKTRHTFGSGMVEIAVFLGLAGLVLIAMAGLVTGDPSSKMNEHDPRSARAILGKIYGPPIGTELSGERNLERTSSAEFPVVASALALKYNAENPDQTWFEEFKAGAVIISEYVAISACRFFFITDQNKTLIKVEDDPNIDPKDRKYKVLDYLVRVGHFFEPNGVGLEATSNPQSVPIEKMIPHPQCAQFLNTEQQFEYDSVALQLVTPLVFNQYVRPASFYSLNFDHIEDKLEEMQEFNIRCNLLVPVGKGELYTSVVEVLSDTECNNLMCMAGVRNGETCETPYDFYNKGTFCILSCEGDVPCEVKGGILICDNHVYGMGVTDNCKLCAPHIISKPMAVIYLVKQYKGNATDEE